MSGSGVSSDFERERELERGCPVEIRKQAFTSRTLRFLNSYEQHPLSELTWYNASAGAKLIDLVVEGVIDCNGVALDVGCGAGAEAMFLSRQGMYVVGLDMSFAALSKAVAMQSIIGTRANWVRADALQLPVRDSCADVVNDSFFFHNVRDSVRAEYACEIFRVLKPGGILIIRGYSDRMSSGSGPRRLTSDDLTTTFSPGFILERLDRFRNVPSEKRQHQWHWLSIWKRRSTFGTTHLSAETDSMG
ncbi:class I SAM-dependent methyltransferase [Bradyrhizobium lablabi]|uniref:class I SAM-dependent methyltransferase n=1 Tax=Bradyrhizobium lablabi TaxID=722472 RepID=UPI001BABDFD4|nr:class I SAM-dependent methyltransferase [Bradyrhizobium lablabi]MBR0696579.1 class I SAM-dependent methyltransferase [Bradyrhizobium lablabi]